MRTSFVLELHREWFEFAEECIGLKSPRGTLSRPAIFRRDSFLRLPNDSELSGCLDILLALETLARITQELSDVQVTFQRI